MDIPIESEKWFREHYGMPVGGILELAIKTMLAEVCRDAEAQAAAPGEKEKEDGSI